MEKAFPWLSLSVIILVFFAISFYQLYLPGLYYDESADAVLAMQLLLGQKMELVRNFGLHIGDAVLPVMVMDYVGTVSTYLLIPFFKVMGIGVISIRSMTVLFGGLTVVLTFILMNRLVNRYVGLTSALLLAVHPSFVFYARQGVHVSSVMSVIALGSLLVLVEWYRTRLRWQLWLGAFLLGLGLSTKVLFLWFILAVIGVFVVREALVKSKEVMLGRRSRNSLRRIAPALLADGASSSRSVPGVGVRMPTPDGLVTAAGTAAAFAAGAWMILYYNYATQGTIDVITRSARISQAGINNLDIFTNFGARLETLRVLLNGGHFWFLGGIFSFDIYPWVFASSLLVVICTTLVWPPMARYRGPAWLFMGIVLFVFIQSPFTVSGIWPTHLFILLPFVTAILSLAGYALCAVLPGRSGYLLSIAPIAFMVLVCLQIDYQYHAVLTETGGRKAQSDAIYRLAEYLDDKGVIEPVAMDWGIKYSVQIITVGRVNPVEIFGYTPEPGGAFMELLDSTLLAPDRLYIFRIPEAAVFPRYQEFTEAVEKLNRKADLVHIAAERDGTPMYLVYRVS
ncbi:MAG: hypothetical protein EXR50_01285 [Dehalococcoidia bacterium]|nr:hypothetical protein [Dehalococcoidia bacterium]